MDSTFGTVEDGLKIEGLTGNIAGVANLVQNNNSCASVEKRVRKVLCQGDGLGYGVRAGRSMIWRSNKCTEQPRYQKLVIAIAQHGQPLIEVAEADELISCSLKLLQMSV